MAGQSGAWTRMLISTRNGTRFGHVSMQKNLEMEAKAQEEAERERKREAIRQRIAAAKAASSGAISEESKPDIKDSKDGREAQGIPTADKDKVKDCEKSIKTTEIIQVGAATEVADAPDCYDVDPASFSTLPLPTKEAGEARPDHTSKLST